MLKKEAIKYIKMNILHNFPWLYQPTDNVWTQEQWNYFLRRIFSLTCLRFSRALKLPGFIQRTWKAFYYFQEILNKVQTCVAFIFPCAAWLHVSLSSTSLLDLVVQQARQRGPIASLPPLMKNQPTNHLSTTLIYLVSGGLLSVYYFC